MEKELYNIPTTHLLEISKMYGSEITITSIGTLWFNVFLTEVQVEELNSIEIFPVKV